MPRYRVSISREMYQTGYIEVNTESPDDAQKEVDALMSGKNPLQTNDPRIEWGEPQYEDFSMQTTGDVEEA